VSHPAVARWLKGSWSGAETHRATAGVHPIERLKEDSIYLLTFPNVSNPINLITIFT